jgi:urease accessory protein
VTVNETGAPERTAFAQRDPIRCEASLATTVRYTASMNDAVTLVKDVVCEAAGWSAELELRYERRGDRTVLSRRRHQGPLAVQKALYPEGDTVCQSVIVHPPGGIVGGDELGLSVEIGAGAHAQLTTPGAARWYRSAGPPARQRISISVGEHGVGEWLPQETIIFDGAIAECDTRVELSEGAVWVGWDIFCLGRRAAGERFEQGRLRQRVEILRCGVPEWIERAVLEADSPRLTSLSGLSGEPVFGTLLAAAERVSDGLLAACRALRASGGEIGVTRLPGLLVARYLGESNAAARDYFTAIWALARPALLARAAVPPRIWST